MIHTLLPNRKEKEDVDRDVGSSSAVSSSFRDSSRVRLESFVGASTDMRTLCP